ncbi:methyltransferase [Streptomyces sp. NPDC048442]|uniref:methyltransferase n=1 Tax=Streptomyces sp. NPDC048442 TaxID=3154823 RepID=UPI0034298B33
MANDDEIRAAGIEDRGHVVKLLFGSMVCQTVRAATRLRVFEVFGEKERSATEVAAETGAHEQATYRLLRALASLGLLEERAVGTFRATPAGTLLDSGRADSLVDMVGMFTEPEMQRGWALLDDGVRTGATTFDTVFGKGFFAHLKDRPELSARFNAAMSQASAETAAALPHAYDFGRFHHVADIGGGDGTLLTAVLQEYPELTGVLNDTEEGLAQAPERLRRLGLTERCSLVTGDFFQSVPEGADLYLIKSILHDWNDEQCATILGHCRAVLPPEGRVLIVEPVLPELVDPDNPRLTYLTDLNMLVNVGGRERTRADFEEVCGRAGLSVVSVTPLGAPHEFSLIEAEAA